MTDALRLLLLLAIAGAAVTVAASFLSWQMDVERRLRRYVRRVLGGEPDAVVVVRGRAAGAGFRLATSQAVVLWQGGAKALLYPLGAFLGGELVVDDKVVARVFRGEPRRALDAVETGARTVTLRLVFDNPKDPDFDLDLWLPQDALRRDAGTAAKAIQEGRSWLARIEAVLRLPTTPAVEPRIAQDKASPEPLPPWEDDDYQPEEPDLFEDED